MGVKFKTNPATSDKYIIVYYTVPESVSLTFGLVVLLGRPPADAGLVLVQVKKTNQSFFLPFQFGHLCAGLHGTHTPLHFTGTQKHALFGDRYMHL